MIPLAPRTPSEVEQFHPSTRTCVGCHQHEASPASFVCEGCEREIARFDAECEQ